MFLLVTIKWLAANDTSFRSSKAICGISPISCWILKAKGSPHMLDSLHFKTHKKIDGSILVVYLSDDIEYGELQEVSFRSH